MKIEIDKSLTKQQLEDAKCIERILIENGLSNNYFTYNGKGEITKVKEFPVTWETRQTHLKVEYQEVNDTYLIYYEKD